MAENNEEQRIKLTFDTNAKQAAADTNKLGASIDDVTSAAEASNKATEQGAEAYKSLKSQIREANQELQKAVQIYGETSDEAIQAARGVAELKDQMQAASDLTQTLNPDQKFKALGAATQVAATGVQGVTAGMALFGDQSESTEKLLLKVQSAMAFSDAISGLSDLSDQWNLLKATISASSLATKANTAATGAAAMVQNLFTGSVNTSSAGFKALKLAIAGTGIGLLVTGLALVVTNFDKIKAVILKVVPGLAAVGEFIGNITDSVTDFIGVTSEADRAIDRMKANADKSLALNKKFLDEHGSQLDEYTKAKIAAVDEYHQLIKEDGANQVALKKELNRKLAAQDKARQDEIDEKRKEAAEKEKAAQEKAQKEAEARAAKEKAAREKQAAENKKNAEFIAGVFADIEKKKKEEQDKADKAYQDSLAENTKAQQAAFEEQKRLEAQALKDRETAAQAKIDLEKAQQTSLSNLANAAINAAKDLFGKNKAVQKGVVVADSAVALGKVATNTIEQVSADNTASPLTFGLPWSAVHIATGALGAASIVANTTKSLQALGGGSAPSAPSQVNLAGSAGQAIPRVAFNNTSANQIGQSIAAKNAEQPPIKVVVNESDITDAQNNVKVLVSKNSI